MLAPDIDAYAPHIEAVFGGALGSAARDPVHDRRRQPAGERAAGRGVPAPARTAAARASSLADVLDLLAVPAIAARFDLDDADRDALQDWLDAAGARWGLDAADRARHGAHGDDAYTLEFALDRLLLGYASGDDERHRRQRSVAPWPELEGQARGRARCPAAAAARARAATQRVLADAIRRRRWASACSACSTRCFRDRRADGSDAARAATACARLIAALRRTGARAAGFDAPVEHASRARPLRRGAGARPTRARRSSPAASASARMVPMRLIPFRVICLLGMDDGDFPRRDPARPAQPHRRALGTRERRVGDPLAARRRPLPVPAVVRRRRRRVFYLSWCGMDPRDGSAREPSALVSELLDAAARYHARR